MSTIYDNQEAMNAPKEAKTDNELVSSPTQPNTTHEPQSSLADNMGEIEHDVQKEAPQKELASIQQRASNALKMVDDIVLKNYLSQLESMKLIEMSSDEEIMDNADFRLFKINKMVYEKDEYATDKFISVVNAMTYANCSIYLIVDGQANHTDFYLGIKGDNSEDRRTSASIAKAFENALKGQFPGILMEGCFTPKENASHSPQQILLKKMKEAKAFSSYTGIPAIRNSKGEYTNANFIQGIEKFATAMQGHRYTAIILATNTSAQEIVNIRQGYENIYTELSAMATQQLAYSTNESMANALSRAKGNSFTYTESETIGTSKSNTISNTSTHTEGVSHSDTKGESKDNKAGKISKALPIVGRVLNFWSKNLNESHSDSTNSSDAKAVGVSDTTSENVSNATSNAVGKTDSITEGLTYSNGSSKNFTITVQNKHIQEILKRIDKQLERIEMSESTGLWSVGTYFLAYDTDRAIAETAASIFRSIMQGEQSGVEVSAVNSWYGNDSTNLIKYTTDLSHPVFSYPSAQGNIGLSPTSLLSSKEVAMMIGLPRKSVPGLPVVDHVSLAKEVVKLGVKSDENKLSLGCVFDQGQKLKDNFVELDVKSLTQHTFVTGSTGCGKSNTIYHLIQQAREKQPDVKFLIVEPAKGEYKDVFGKQNNKPEVPDSLVCNFEVYGTNPNLYTLLKINPFRFPKGVHVLEHVDRLTEIFNVCWPMYAAMPAVLKEAMLNSYEDCGWDLYSSTNEFSEELFPTFTDLLNELKLVILNSAYSEEVKSNYTGSLVTRVNSLAVGINKQVFCGNELGDEKLFDENVIVDLSRIGSQETKALIMGILIMRLNEYRANSEIGANSGLRHITILEEAHNILKRCSTEQNMEGSNVAGKSVEMISNSIAEMRTYGEGFVIVDQSPGAVDISAIRNTNTKIIMRLPEETDRKVAGKAAAMKDEQIDEIAKLPTGVAVVYQNDWEAPVLCQISEFKGERHEYTGKPEKEIVHADSEKIRLEVLKFLLKGRIKGDVEFDTEKISKELYVSEMSSYNKIKIFRALREYEKDHEITLWKDNHFKELSRLVTEIVSLKTKVENLVRGEKNFDILDEALCRLVHETIPELPQELELELRHCLMCDYALENEMRIELYNAWFQNVARKIV